MSAGKKGKKSWKEEHEAIYGRIEDQKFLPRSQSSIRIVKKGTVRVSPEADSHVQEFMDASFQMRGTDPEDREAAHLSFSILKQRERELYEYIEVLEAAVPGLRRSIVKRF